MALETWTQCHTGGSLCSKEWQKVKKSTPMSDERDFFFSVSAAEAFKEFRSRLFEPSEPLGPGREPTCSRVGAAGVESNSHRAGGGEETGF